MVPPAAPAKAGTGKGRGPAGKLRQKHIDIFNSTSTGHQVGGGVSKPASWHRSRSTKLQHQFKNDPPPLELIATLPSAPAVVQIADKTDAATQTKTAGAAASPPTEAADPGLAPASPSDPSLSPTDTDTITIAALTTSFSSPPLKPTAKIFQNCTIYINGTTAPAISDHLLKRHLCFHGAVIATILLRKSVTHVILGKPNDGDSGAGGGLAAGKMHKELAKKGGKLIKYVSVEWALDSIKAGKRLSESQYSVINMYGESQKNILSFVKPRIPTSSAASMTVAKSTATSTTSHSHNVAINKVTAATTTTAITNSKSIISKVPQDQKGHNNTHHRRYHNRTASKEIIMTPRV